jgi:hypothetical protein
MGGRLALARLRAGRCYVQVFYLVSGELVNQFGQLRTNNSLI